MNAPHEVWLSPDWPNYLKGETDYPKGKDGYVRYLRADLTCGECGVPWGFREQDCPRGFCFPTSKRLIAIKQEHLGKQVACMKFTLKAVKP